MGSGSDFHNSHRSMGDLSLRHYRQEIGKLSNYRCEEAHYSALNWVCLGASFFLFLNLFLEILEVIVERASRRRKR